MALTKYSADWPDNYDDLEIELWMIRKGDAWLRQAGRSLAHHYEMVRRLCWPHLDDHRWHRLCRDEILKNKVTVLLGPGSSGKTHEAAWISLVEFFAWPEETCVLVSSTDIRGLKKRVWGEITDLWEKAVERWPNLPGHLLDSAIAITTDDMEDVEAGERKARDMRKGIFGVPCIQGGRFVGLGKFIGIKQKRMRLVADEASMMSESFLSAFANLNKNEDFRAIVLGNPNDPLDPLGRAAEPKEGWTDEYMEPEKTIVWDTRFMAGRCVNLIGTDSPNFDFPPSQPTRYKYLISREKIADTLSFFPKDSIEYYSQCIGSMKIGTLSRRIISRSLCNQFGAFTGPQWRGMEQIRIAALDAAYGGDRCVLGHADFGPEINGKIVVAFFPPVIVPVRVTGDTIPEDQIAVYVKDYCTSRDINPENFFHDSTGRGTLGTSLARSWSSQCNPVEFGGVPSKRPVSLDMMISENGIRRLKLCDEHYVKRVTEYWFSVRYAIESGQVREFPEDVMEEMSMREWRRTKNDRVEIESKQDMKERVGRSPDLGDWASIIIEGCRQRGFLISKLGVEQKDERGEGWLEREQREYEKVIRGHLLHHV